MKHLTKWIGKLLFLIMAIALIAYAASRTLDFVNSTLGANDQIIGYLALFATTGGALAWLAVYLWNSKGIAQKGIALIMVCVDVLGEITLFTIDTLMQSGTNGVITTLTPEEIRLTILGMSFLIGANIIAIFAFHIMDMESTASIELHFRNRQIEKAEDEVEQAIVDAKVAKSKSLAAAIAEREASEYGFVQVDRNRADHTLPEKGLFSRLGEAFGKNNKKAPSYAAATAPLPQAELKKTPQKERADKPANSFRDDPAWSGGLQDPETGELHGI